MTAARVLVVDDEPGLCELACLWLEAMGHEAVPAQSAAQALELLQAQPFDVLFSDIVMPGGMDGFALGRTAVQAWPGLKVLFASGYAWSGDAHGISGTRLLDKPYRKDDLRKALDDLLAGWKP